MTNFIFGKVFLERALFIKEGLYEDRQLSPPHRRSNHSLFIGFPVLAKKICDLWIQSV